MRAILPVAFVSAWLVPAMLGADSPTAPAEPTPSPKAASVAAASDNRVVFGVITLSDDHRTITVQVKEESLSLSINERTEITLDLQKVDVTRLNLKEPVRVTYSGSTALAIDQLKDKKRKKKKNPE